MEYHEIGERFEYDGVVFEVTEARLCKDRFFLGNITCVLESPMSCWANNRKDKKCISYKLIEQCKTKDMKKRNDTKKLRRCKKNDRLDDKLRWELLPLEDVEDIVRVYTAGAKKYGPDQWQNLPDGIRRYKAALLRHLVEFDKGNEIDEETGCRHLAQVAWNAIAMLHISKQQKQ